MNDNEREQLQAITRGLMLSDHLGDVHHEINRLYTMLGQPKPEGDFLDGWTLRDWLLVGGDADDWDDDA